MDRARIVRLITSMSIPFLAAAIGNVFTGTAITTWYPTLVKPWFTPPNWVFGPVWTGLYALMGLSLYRIRSQGSGHMYSRALAFFGIQLALNALWSITFFGARSLIGGLFIIVLLDIVLIETIRRFNRIDQRAAVLLVPYLIWVLFATVLNAAIVLLN